jgi:hypothetical protein
MSNVDNNSEKNSNGISPEDLNASSQKSADKGQSKSSKKRNRFPFIKSSNGHDEEETPHEEEQEDLIDSRLEGLQDNHHKTQSKNKTKTVLGFETLLTDYDEEASNPFVIDENEEGEQPVQKNTKLPSRDTEPFKSDFPLYEMQETTTYYDHDFSEDEIAEEKLSESELAEYDLTEDDFSEDENPEDEEIYLKDLFEKTPEESSEPENKPVFPESVLRFKKSSDEDDEDDFAALRSSLWDKEEAESEDHEEESAHSELEDEFEFEIGGDEEDQKSPFTVDINSFNQIDEDFVFPQDGNFQRLPPLSQKIEEKEEENFEDRSFFREEKTQKIPERASDLLESLPETRESLLEGIQEEVQRDLEGSAEKEEVLTKKEKGTRKKVLLIVSVLFVILIAFSLAALWLFNRDKPEEISVVITPISAAEGIHPVGLRLPGGWYFLLQTGEIVNGKWEPQVAEWLSGTEVQRIVAIPWTKQLEAYIEALEPGLETQLVMNNNDLLDYKIQKIEEVPRSQVEILSQTEASLVIIIFQADVDERWVITCQPLATEQQN